MIQLTTTPNSLEYNYLNFTVAAINSLCPNAKYGLSGDKLVYVYDEEGNFTISNLDWQCDLALPSEEDYTAKFNEEMQKWISLEYQRLRQPEYPPLVQLADALYWQAQGDESKMTAYLAAVEAVKQKYPKGV